MASLNKIKEEIKERMETLIQDFEYEGYNPTIYLREILKISIYEYIDMVGDLNPENIIIGAGDISEIIARCVIEKNLSSRLK